MAPHPRQFLEFYKKYVRFVPAVAFVLGFLFDIVMLTRIDDLLTIIQQAIYLLIIAALIGVELINQVRTITPPKFLKKVWIYREFALHFLIGSLLNTYVIFYFKSASGFVPFLFILTLLTALTITEFKKFGETQIIVHMTLMSLCLISYFEALVPILLGFIGYFPFFLGLMVSGGFFYLFFQYLKPRMKDNAELLQTHVLMPFSATILGFAFLYLSHILPPIPLSVSYMGIYHEVEKKNGEFILSYTRPWWRFWEHGDESFYARPGDTLIGYAQVFSPGRFKDKLQIRWTSKNARGDWEPQDAIPLEVSGGREEGFRIAVVKKNYHPGNWRVQIETTDNREVGWLGYEIYEDKSTGPRELRKVTK
ncbi:MAG: DUF2914 domain-containing protein [Xanthomonadaceae bacterium]|nr:DUF2914 domain-containing protein [Xanthomonadaceae bacterium]